MIIGYKARKFSNNHGKTVAKIVYKLKLAEEKTGLLQIAFSNDCLDFGCIEDLDGALSSFS